MGNPIILSIENIEAVEENIKLITGKNKEDIQKNLSASFDLLKVIR